MAKLFYVTENTPDYAQVNFFRTEKEALEYGASELEGFAMFDEPMNDGGESSYQGESLTFKKGILFSQEGGEVYVQAMEEDAAREYAQGLGDEGGAIFFDGFQRGMYGYLGETTNGKGFKWFWDGYDLNESKNTNMKHIKLFEEFINEANEADIAEEILQDLLGERDPDEIDMMDMTDALDTVEAYGHKGAKAKKIANHLMKMAQSGSF